MHFLESRRPKVEELAREQMPKLGVWELASSLENTLSVHSIFRVSQEVTGQKISNGGLFKPNGRGRGARALLEPRCGGTEGTEYLHISFKSSAGFVLIVYAFMYAFIFHYWIIFTECAIL